ncbi:hypothetical protein, partial [Gordonibacter sp.]|uniref:hypothetical protein n=1 Tax=Gordonibacter sp. TaxID=1968902 RepID=UPI002FCBC7CE
DDPGLLSEKQSSEPPKKSLQERTSSLPGASEKTTPSYGKSSKGDCLGIEVNPLCTMCFPSEARSMAIVREVLGHHMMAKRDSFEGVL